MNNYTVTGPYTSRKEKALDIALAVAIGVGLAALFFYGLS